MRIDVTISYEEMKWVRDHLPGSLKRFWKVRMKRYFAQRYLNGGRWIPMFWFVFWGFPKPLRRCCLCHKIKRQSRLVQGYCPECVRVENAYFYGTE